MDKMFEDVDIVVVIDPAGGLETLYARGRRLRVALIDYHWDHSDRFQESESFETLERQDRERLNELMKEKLRHFHIGLERDGRHVDGAAYKSADDVMEDVRDQLVEDNLEENQRLYVYVCMRDCAEVKE